MGDIKEWWHKCDGPFYCPECNERYRTYGWLKRHVEHKHKAVLLSPTRILHIKPVTTFFGKV